jgi:sulfite reductase (ferredoxin)
MKYLLEEWGVEKFRAKVEEYLGKALQPFKPLPEWKYEDYLGWHEQGDGKLFFGLSVENGRVKDDGDFQLKTALRKVIEQFQLPIRLTANHNILIYEIAPSQKAKIEAIFKEHHVITNPDKIDDLVRYSMACPAWPTCGLAVTESERVLPSINERIRAILKKVGLAKQSLVVRMTGCPNGCARPYMAELGFVGSAPDTYQIWLGGTPNQTRLAQAYTDKLAIADLENFLEPLFVYFKQERQENESFGEFCHRLGFEALRQFSASYQAKASGASLVRKNKNRVSVDDELFAQLKDASVNENRPMNQIIGDALTAYFDQQQK